MLNNFNETRLSAFRSLICVDKNLVSEAINHCISYLRFFSSDSCNIRCSFCHKEGVSKLRDYKKPKTVKLIDYIKNGNHQFQKVHITGGEPFMDSALFEYLFFFAEYFNEIGVTSNGTLIKHFKNQLPSIPQKVHFNISLFSLDHLLYKMITKEDLLKDSIEGLEILLQNGFNCRINTIVIKENISELERITKFAAEKGLLLKLFDFICEDEKQVIYTKQIYDILNEKNRLVKLGITYRNTDYKCVSSIIRLQNRLYSNKCLNCIKFPCGEGYFSIRVYANGSVKTCIESIDFSEPSNSLPISIDMARKSIINDCKEGFIIMAP